MGTAAKRDFTCNITKNRKGLIHAEGQCLYNGCTFQYSINAQSHGPYLMRGRISAISARDGSILKVRGKSLRDRKKRLKDQGQGPTSEAFSIKSEINLNSTNRADIEKAVKKAAERLYKKYAQDILDDAREISADGMRPSQAVRVHGARFLATEKGNADTQKRKEREMMQIAAKLDAYTMDSIPQTALSSIYKELPEKTRGSRFRLLERFWSYCRDIGVYHGQNPFEQFLMKNPSGKKATPEELQRKAMQPASIPEKVERVLNQRIREASPEDAKMTGLLLIKEAGFSASEACQLRWDDVKFNQMGRPEATVQFEIQKDFSAGATHDYKRPGSPRCARELHRRAEFFQRQWGTLEGHSILEDLSGRRVESKALTAFCRDELLHCGMGAAELAPDHTEPYGIGVRLLLSNYKYRIAYRSGFQEDSGAVDYLMGHSLSGNVTADHYRSMTSPEGQDFLLNVLSRDKTFEDAPPDGTKMITTEQNGDMTKITARAKDPRRFNHVTLTVRLEPGQTLEVCAPGILQGSVKAKKVK